MPLNVQVTQLKGVISLDWGKCPWLCVSPKTSFKISWTHNTLIENKKVGNSVCGDSFSLTRQELVPGLSTEEQPHEEVSYAKNIEKIQSPNTCGSSKTGKFALTTILWNPLKQVASAIIVCSRIHSHAWLPGPRGIPSRWNWLQILRQGKLVRVWLLCLTVWLTARLWPRFSPLPESTWSTCKQLQSLLTSYTSKAYWFSVQDTPLMDLMSERAIQVVIIIIPFSGYVTLS